MQFPLGRTGSRGLRLLAVLFLALGYLACGGGLLHAQEPEAPAPATAATQSEPDAEASPTPAEITTAETEATVADTDSDIGDWMAQVDAHFGEYLVGPLASVLFFDFFTERLIGVPIPFIVLWLLFGATFFTIRMGFINIRGFLHAIRLTKGDYDDPNNPGEVSHFQALASALSATVGLGNIAGVAIAVGVGGPGAVFWMILAGLLGMSSKFTECSLGQLYRRVAPDGTVSGGPMHYLREGMITLGWGPIGRGFGTVMAILFAILCIGASFGGGCAFQVNQSGNAILELVQTEDRNRLVVLNQELETAQMANDAAQVTDLETEIAALISHMSDQERWIKPGYGLIMAFLVGLVIIGGIRRIAATAGKVVPLMCGLYMACCLYILIINYQHIPAALLSIITGIWDTGSLAGGALGVLITGIRRAAFSNEAGIGSASIAHAAAKTKEPISEGFVALLEPFIDTVVVCTMTALVIIITGVYEAPEFASIVAQNRGAALTAAAFSTVASWFPILLTVAVVLFAYSTMISWSYYGERCWTFLFGTSSSMIYRSLFLLAVFGGAIITATNVLDFSDLMILSMALPNILGCILLSGVVRRRLDDYWGRVRSGEIAKVAE